MIFLINLILSIIFTLIIIKISHKLKIYDYPNGRKMHNYPVPRIGGLGFILPIILSTFLFTDILEKLTLFTIALLIIVFEGLFDDIANLHFSQKFTFEFFSASFIFLSGYGIKTIGFDVVLHPAIGFVITIIGFVGVINAFNMLDGLDGLLTLVSIIIFSTFSYFFSILGNTELFIFSIGIISALLGFLFFNFPIARVFMGDVGALTLGFLSASFSLFLTQGKNSIYPIVPVIILSIPIFDTIWTIIRRILSKYPIFYSDKRHLHHILYRRFGKFMTVFIISTLQLFFSVLAILTYKLDEIYLWLIAFLCFIIVGVLGYEKSYNIWFWRSRQTSSR
ncbi:MAG: MraY family glycosyltransferase [candidate division WOR-3 bacterium]|nr:undecaprenyl/decaprenyl-phosphate alpha-N-acetylglucosaminyl 1-phosphate transferase [candidate division WOR-3 bacterium]MDW8149948.1 MraY family glycosyltransferase [candidate division WOR-3 bacterium]